MPRLWQYQSRDTSTILQAPPPPTYPWGWQTIAPDTAVRRKTPAGTEYVPSNSPPIPISFNASLTVAPDKAVRVNPPGTFQDTPLVYPLSAVSQAPLGWQTDPPLNRPTKKTPQPSHQDQPLPTSASTARNPFGWVAIAPDFVRKVRPPAQDLHAPLNQPAASTATWHMGFEAYGPDRTLRKNAPAGVEYVPGNLLPPATNQFPLGWEPQAPYTALKRIGPVGVQYVTNLPLPASTGQNPLGWEAFYTHAPRAKPTQPSQPQRSFQPIIAQAGWHGVFPAGALKPRTQADVLAGSAQIPFFAVRSVSGWEAVSADPRRRPVVRDYVDYRVVAPPILTGWDAQYPAKAASPAKVAGWEYRPALAFPVPLVFVVADHQPRRRNQTHLAFEVAVPASVLPSGWEASYPHAKVGRKRDDGTIFFLPAASLRAPYGWTVEYVHRSTKTKTDPGFNDTTYLFIPPPVYKGAVILDVGYYDSVIVDVGYYQQGI